MRKSFYKIKIVIKNFISGNYAYFFWLFPIKNNRIHITSYYGKGWGDNLKYVAELLNDNSDVEIIWSVNNNTDKSIFPKYIKLAKYNSLRNLYFMSTSKIWLDNCRKIIHPPKRNKQIYYQLWHGGIPLKKIENDAPHSLSKHYIYRAINDSKMADLMLSNSKFKTEIIKNSFWYEGEILEYGIPKIDLLVNGNNEIIFKVKEYFDIKDKAFILYAPTFRNSKNTDIYKFNFKKIVNTFEKKFGKEFVILIRLHPNISNLSNFINYSDKIINASNYADMQELLLASDALITDYSGIMFEYIYMDKPVFLYTPDLEKYNKERGTYLNIDELPFSNAMSESTLIQNILSYDTVSYLEETSKLMHDLGMVSNENATQKVFTHINKNLIGEKNEKI